MGQLFHEELHMTMGPTLDSVKGCSLTVFPITASVNNALKVASLKGVHWPARDCGTSHSSFSSDKDTWPECLAPQTLELGSLCRALYLGLPEGPVFQDNHPYTHVPARLSLWLDLSESLTLQ